MNIHYRFTDKELNVLMKENLMVIFDTRERENKHILDYFDKMKIPYKRQKIDEGDYTAIITKREEYGIHRDLYFPIAVERKNSIDEFAGNLAEKLGKGESGTDIRLIRELRQAKNKGIKLFLVLEDKDAMENIKSNNYRSLFKPIALMARLSSIQDLYFQDTIFTDKADAGFEIYRKLYYGVRNCLKELSGYIGPEEENKAVEEIARHK